jgi:uncharacterized protein
MTDLTDYPPSSIRVADSLTTISPLEWNDLAQHNPTLHHAWLQSMIDAGCTTSKTGWLPQFVLLEDENNTLQGALPLYMKSHSYGEYVFDWAWAEAYARAGLDYYPKLVCAVPFTPCEGNRIMASTEANRTLLLDAMLQIANDSDVSSLHILFPAEMEQSLLCNRALMMRQSIQFHWQNEGDNSFDAFLSRMNHDKRKKIRQERKSLAAKGVRFVQKIGHEITTADWDFFTRCYNNTYRAHRSTPYLNREFFALIGERMPENLLLVTAVLDDMPIAASLNLYNAHTLYGRYWGSTTYIPGLHFETCYYQTIEFCIARGIKRFEGGAQGEHKLARGFTPVTCHSAHWIREPRFANAVADYLSRETEGISCYINELNEHQPFKHR